MQEKRETSSHSSWVTILIGFVLSIALGILPIFLNQNYSLALLIALVGIAATFLLDLSIRFTETREDFSKRVTVLETDIAALVQKESEDIKRAIKLGDYLARDTEIRHTIESIVNTCEEVKSLNVDVFTRKIDEYLTECYKKINDLADGEEILDSEFSFFPSEHSHQKSTATIVTSTEPLFLDTTHGRNLVNALGDSIKRNRDITFIWIQEKQILHGQEFRALVNEQEKVGVTVLIAEKESVPPKLQRDYGIVHQRYFYTYEISNGKQGREKVSNNRDELRKIEADLSQLKPFVESPNRYYDQLKKMPKKPS